MAMSSNFLSHCARLNRKSWYLCTSNQNLNVGLYYALSSTVNMGPKKKRVHWPSSWLFCNALQKWTHPFWPCELVPLKNNPKTANNQKFKLYIWSPPAPPGIDPKRRTRKGWLWVCGAEEGAYTGTKRSSPHGMPISCWEGGWGLRVEVLGKLTSISLSSCIA